VAAGWTDKAEFACRGGRRIRNQNEFFCEFVFALTIWHCFLGNEKPGVCFCRAMTKINAGFLFSRFLRPICLERKIFAGTKKLKNKTKVEKTKNLKLKE